MTPLMPEEKVAAAAPAKRKQGKRAKKTAVAPRRASVASTQGKSSRKDRGLSVVAFRLADRLPVNRLVNRRPSRDRFLVPISITENGPKTRRKSSSWNRVTASLQLKSAPA